MNTQTMHNGNIENKHWEGMEETTGLTKEQFQRELTLEEEITEFLNEVEEWMLTSRRIRSNINFDPHLFLQWRISKKNGN